MFVSISVTSLLGNRLLTIKHPEKLKERDMLSEKARQYSIGILKKAFFISAFLIQIIMPARGHAQSAITSDGTLDTAVTFDQGNYTISDGTIKGSNQFHSFGRFNVPTEESATFTGPQTIENIISRVTGSEVSEIDGRISSEIDGANLFLVNPTGILFGPNATLDVKGSFHASTADFVRLSDGGIFYADPGGNSTLTVASPASFGFLDGNPAGITIEGSALEVPEGKTLSVVGGDVEIVGAAEVTNLVAPGGRVNIASVSSPGEVIPNAAGAPSDLNVESFEDLGRISLSQGASIDAGGPGGGTVIIRGGRFVMDGSFVKASIEAAGGGAVGAGIDIKATEDVVIDNSSQMETNVWNGVADNSGGIRIGANHLEVSNFSQINSLAFGAFDGFPASTGKSGDIELATNSLLLRDGSSIRSGTGGLGDAGDIVIDTANLEVRDAAWVMSDAWAGAGNSGDVNITADSILLSNVKYPGFLTGISPRTYDSATGKAGDVRVTANSLQILGGTEISTPTWSAGRGGNITLTIDGDVSIQGNEALLPWQTGIFANTFGPGPGGSLSLTADSLEMTSKTTMQTSTFWTADAGNTLLNVGRLEVKDRSQITTSGLFGAGGSSGDLQINAESVLISGPENSADPFGADFTGLSTVAGPSGGQGGDLTIAATDSVTLTSRASISNSSQGPGTGGNLTIETGTLQVLNGSSLIASAFGSGNGGTIAVNANTVLVSGVHPQLYTDITGTQSLAPSGIASQTGLNGGSAGGVKIVAGSLEISDGGRLSVETFGPGDGGSLEVEASNVLISGVNPDLRDLLISNDANPKYAAASILSGSGSFFLGDAATGQGGNIELKAESIELSDGALISSETETPGDGGYIKIEADNVALSGGASIAAESRVAFATRTGKAGNISITANETFSSDSSSVTTAAELAEGGDVTIKSWETYLANNSLISAESSGPGDAGNITLTATDILYMKDSSIITEAKQADGGNIKINVDGTVHIVDSEISASVGGGPETVGGNINIDPEFVILNNSKIIANAFAGKGGNIQIVADVFLADPDSVIDASSDLGIDGTVEIRAPIKDVSQKLKLLPKRVLRARDLIHEPCIARLHGERYSSFVVSGRYGLPPEPSGFLPSPLQLE